MNELLDEMEMWDEETERLIKWINKLERAIRDHRALTPKPTDADKKLWSHLYDA
jgi:hypothetical protein